MIGFLEHVETFVWQNLGYESLYGSLLPAALAAHSHQRLFLRSSIESLDVLLSRRNIYVFSRNLCSHHVEDQGREIIIWCLSWILCIVPASTVVWVNWVSFYEATQIISIAFAFSWDRVFSWLNIFFFFSLFSSRTNLTNYGIIYIAHCRLLSYDYNTVPIGTSRPLLRKDGSPIVLEPLRHFRFMNILYNPKICANPRKT